MCPVIGDHLLFGARLKADFICDNDVSSILWATRKLGFQMEITKLIYDNRLLTFKRRNYGLRFTRRITVLV